ncbi:pentatricopeptide repeat-containing protein At4g33990 isoform X1 [Sesamum indicum]|uniref:Pentatricopeptide repeat-containing protein At4g33990 isoform X1 n=2 Tax=Sesamum indicum TaxID=4182 RepID=A0A6I9TY93_SESIN|nr:pentatricopeptide repeat-containing protein At4g33990 isoform X1 [Sesamum indicum]XP_011086451.1 pentatricopeptide repeat-containing protein At4g33990 isoform X1 [Sesamum indicum]XP_011086453.1 pentatricopeptide repeat-containing protein At4g33990 isoform X1 [Sesamum indicum]XP_011086454.1 pentatricopeptide repeat-containing protein At4g33990 isoform X1 [Sesamum indicum]XP_011086455.1 pentatricopeptide repeat-containing protein At4g33990 isoform X1 [Sesamum indicum]XP_011086457.1 pentatrico
MMIRLWQTTLRSNLLFPTCKGVPFLKLWLSTSCYLLHSHEVSCIGTLSHGTYERNREIDFEILFNACTTLEVAKRLHALLIVSGEVQSIFVATRLVNIYSHLGDVSSSRDIFNEVPRKDAYTWNSMVSAYVRNRRFSEAVECAYEMLSSADARPDFHTFPPVLKACNSLLDGTRLHCWILKLGLEWDVFVAASLVHMYCRFGFSGSAYLIFKDMPNRDMGCWNSMISGFCQNGNAEAALSILGDMGLAGVEMDSVTVATVLSICAQMNDILHGALIHLFVIKHGLEFNVFVSNALINMYAKFGELKCAQNVFDHMDVRDLVSWNSIIAAYEQNYYPYDALKFFHQMQSNKVKPDLLTIVSLSSSVAQTKDFISSKTIHGYIMRRCWIMEDTVVGNGVVDMYAKLGIIDSALKVFEELPRKDVISWNTMITGYAQNGFASEAIEVFCRMKENNDLTLNQGTWVSIIPAYAHLGALRDGMRVHGHVLKEGLDSDVFVSTCLIDLYGKCGRLGEALSLFYEASKETSVPWNAIISCHGLHGLGETSLRLFRDMLNVGVKPDHVTFLSLLTACSHSGLVDQGKWCFHVMQQEYGIKPTLKHYGCMVDLFGRAGLLEIAYNFIDSMPLRPDASIWGALLGACKIHGNVEMGRKASSHLFEIDSENVGYYVLLSNLYANFGHWEGVGEVRSLARNRGLWKTPGWSSIELNNRIEVFYTGSQSHPQCEEIYKELAILNAKIKGLGYTPDYSFVLQDVEDDEKENILAGHSERLAIVYGILNTPPKTSIRIFKNLRVCGDCHSVTKFISKLTEREIIVRDSNRFHHFKDGLCSCGDYW